MQQKLHFFAITQVNNPGPSVPPLYFCHLLLLAFQIIIDEAGMCPEPHCLVPIVASNAEQVVLIGDHKQLRPVIKCKEAAELGLEKSLFEKQWLSENTQGVEKVMLKRQYRMVSN